MSGISPEDQVKKLKNLGKNRDLQKSKVLQM